MRKLVLFAAAIMAFAFTQAEGQWVGINSDNPAPVSKQLISSDVQTSVVHFEMDGFFKKQVQTPRGAQYVLTADGATPILKKGAPNVAKMTASVIIPDQDRMQVEVTDAKYKEYTGIEVAPSKGNLYRNVDPDEVPYEYGKEYEKNAFYPADQAMLRKPYILRDYRGQAIVVHPFRYNPVTQTLRVYYDITVKVTSTGEPGENQLVREKPLNTVDPEFQHLYDAHFLNNNNNSRYDPLEEEGSMLIIAYGDFMDAMQPFVDWKIMTGRQVEMVDVADVGSSSSDIESYIETYYNENDLTYCLLVGDADQVPTSYATGDSDNAYAYIEGSDSYPELFMGRFSAENVDEVSTQVTRTINYEKEPYTEEEWYPNSISVGSSQGPGDDGEYDYEHLRNIQDDLNGFTYTYNYEYFDGSQGGNDDPGSPSPDDVAEGINSGSTIINYTGHGSTTSWGSSGFSNNDVNDLINGGKLPFIWSVACVNGNFVNNTCFAEAWMRATNTDGEPTGAVATLMSTINQSWDPPMHGQDEMNDIFTEQYEDNIKRTFGGLSFNGCMEMNDEYGSAGDEMTDTWTLFGDPSVMVRSDNPVEISADHNPTVFLGTSTFEVTVSDAEGATVAMTMDGEIYGTASVEGGSATVDFGEPISTTGTMNLVITGFNKIPYITELEVVPAEGPYISLAGFELNDNTGGNGNGEADYGETILLSVDLENIGVEPAEDVALTLTSEDEYVTINDGEEDAGTIPDGETVTVADAFSVSVAADVPDHHVMGFTLEATSGEDVWDNNMNITANAPVLHSGMVTIDDSEEGNDNGRLDPGETVDVIVPSMNEGHAAAENTVAHLTTLSGYATVQNTVYNIDELPAGETTDAIFTVSCEESTPIGTVISFDYELEANEYNYTNTFTLTAGLILEDWESNGFSSFNWQFAGDADWVIDEENAYEGASSARSGDIDDSESSELVLEYEVMQDDSIYFYRKVSSESNYDYLEFYIDDTKLGEWAGEKDWAKVGYPVSAGEHTFKWVYDKDGSQSDGQDCGWVDFIVLPPEMTLTASAGPDMTECGQHACELQGNATAYESLEWTTSGDGSFDDANAMQPNYMPGDNDMANGSVTLTMHVTGEEDTMEDDMTLTLNHAPTVAAGDDNTVCEGSAYGLSATAENHAGVQWATSGTGTFGDETLLETTYTPSAEDAESGEVTLTLTAMGQEACADSVDNIVLTVNALPEAAAAPTGTTTLCAGTENDYTVEAVSGADSYSWMITPEEAGTVEGEGQTATVTWNSTYGGTAEVQVAGMNGCGEGEYSTPLAVTVDPLPEMPEMTEFVDTVDHAYSDTSTFTISESANAESYEWLLVPEEAGTLTADGMSAEIEWDDNFTGDATVKAKATNGCGDQVNEKAVKVISTIGIGEEADYDVAVYPNPNEGRFSLQLRANKDREVDIRVISPLNQMVYRADDVDVDDSYKTTIDLGNASGGMYYLVIEGKSGRKIEKIIIR